MVAYSWTSGGISSSIMSSQHRGAQCGQCLPLPFESMFIAEEPVSHMISELYQLLTLASPITKPAYNREWERDLESKFSEGQLIHLY